MKRVVLLLFAIGLWLAPDNAWAFHNADFATSVNRGGGAGMYFTGAPRWKNYDCTMCHIGAPETMRIELESDPPELITDGVWTPGAQYAITVTMVGASKGATTTDNGYDFNSFVAEIDDDQGAAVGSYDTPDPDSVYTMAINGGDPRIVAGYAEKGETSWTILFRAPAAGRGRLTLYLGAVDGNAAGGGVATPVDPFGDDVFVGKARFCEAGTSCDKGFTEVSFHEAKKEADAPMAHGCALAVGEPRSTLSWLLLWVAAALVRRRAAALVGLVALTGCAQQTEPWPVCVGDDCAYDVSGQTSGTSPSLDNPSFRCDVQPVLMVRCSFYVCHGNEDRPFRIYAPGRLRLGSEQAQVKLQLTPEERQENYTMAIAFSRDDSPSSSLLLTKPLDARAGGYYHFGDSLYYDGTDVFDSQDDVGYQRILAWIGGGTAPKTCQASFDVGQ